VGVIFFPEDNPGPSTNIGSAVFNTCVVIGSSLIFLPKAKNGWKILPKPFFRDAVSFIIATTCTYIAYLVYTPKFLYWRLKNNCRREVERKKLVEPIG
jgi:Ca2+/Na+ antiporter